MNLLRTIFIAMVTVWALAGTAGAHAYVQSSTPADGSEMDSPPTEIRVTFTEELETGLSRLTLVNALGQPVPGTVQQAEGGNVLVLQVPPLPNGVYTVQWQVLSKDTHVTEGTITFAAGVPLPRSRPADPLVIGGAPPDQGSTPSAPPPAGPAPAEPAPAEPESSAGPPAPAPAVPSQDAPNAAGEAAEPGRSASPPVDPSGSAADPAGNAIQADEPDQSQETPGSAGPAPDQPAPEPDPAPQTAVSGMPWLSIALAGLLVLGGGLLLALRRRKRAI